MLRAVVLLKLAALAVVCIAAPFAGTALLVTNLLLLRFSPLGNSGWALAVMLAVNAVLWLIAGLSCPYLSASVRMLFAFLMTAALWMPVTVDAGDGR